MLKRLYAWLDGKVLPWPILVMTNAAIITLTFALLVPLVLFKEAVVFVLLANSFLNVSSAGVSMAVLRSSMQAEATRQALFEAQELRAKQDHLALMTELGIVRDIQTLLKEQVNGKHQK